jgi:hypothetical protein
MDWGHPVTAREAWARALIQNGRKLSGRLPLYGSAAWERLPDGDPLRVASTVAAAEAWYTEANDFDRFKANLAIELQVRRAAEEQDAADRWADAAARVRELGQLPSFDELTARRRDGVS